MTSQDSDIFDIIIRGATVIDGTRRPRFDADVGIRDGRIARIGDLRACTASEDHRCGGKIVAPGFIDSHTHDDAAVLLDPEMTCKISQGVTTVVTGNCGISLAPLSPDAPRPMPLSLLTGDEHAPRASFSRFADYLDAVRRAPSSVNVAAMVGHTSLRVMTMDLPTGQPMTARSKRCRAC